MEGKSVVCLWKKINKKKFNEKKKNYLACSNVSLTCLERRVDFFRERGRYKKIMKKKTQSTYISTDVDQTHASMNGMKKDQAAASN